KFGMCCTPNCTGKACGDDGCGGSCGECSCGTLLLTWGVPGGTGNGELRRPGDAATDASGNIYVADADNHRIQKFDARGTFLTTWGASARGTGSSATPSAWRPTGAGTSTSRMRTTAAFRSSTRAAPSSWRGVVAAPLASRPTGPVTSTSRRTPASRSSPAREHGFPLVVATVGAPQVKPAR